MIPSLQPAGSPSLNGYLDTDHWEHVGQLGIYHWRTDWQLVRVYFVTCVVTMIRSCVLLSPAGPHAASVRQDSGPVRKLVHTHL